ncbi:uncharacterized protein [Lepeophtheirus salmonis]|uniref:uncharacterized protein n=1 Tax=Lepeophtheirus salmonis TaxID=72036 RepID=UPI001AE439CF|nr:poly [ADP-ribose] polymerase tankyrase-like [Lepeophtheirus salmonis]XP_040569094.1 poly [ADP-ribose] polymerase tankyrase-like [Lepeophtheirus salmonis]
MPTTDDERLLRAAKNGDLGIVQDMYRRYPTNHFTNPQRFKNSVTPLHAACLSGKSPMVVNFLLSQGADPNALDAWHCTPLHNAAAGSGRSDMVDSLLRYGARMDIPTAKGLNAIDLARSLNKYETLRVMTNWKEPDVVDTSSYVHPQGASSSEHVVNNNGERMNARDEEDEVVQSPRSIERTNKKKALIQELRLLEYDEKMNQLKRMEDKQGRLRESISKEYSSEIQNLQERIFQLQKDMNKEMDTIDYNFDIIHKRMKELSMTSEEKVEE